MMCLGLCYILRCRAQMTKIFYFLFYWCNIWQFNVTWVKVLTGEVANRAGVSGTRSGVHRFTSNSWMTVTALSYATLRGQSARETFLHYWSPSEMQEDWDDVCALVQQASSPLSGSTLMGQGCPWCVGLTDVQSSIQVHASGVGVSLMCWFNRCLIPCPVTPIWSSVQVHVFKCVNVDLAYLVLAVRSMKMICWGLLLQMAGSSCSHGARWPQMWPMDSWSILHIPALICSGLSVNG